MADGVPARQASAHVHLLVLYRSAISSVEPLERIGYNIIVVEEVDPFAWESRLRAWDGDRLSEVRISEIPNGERASHSIEVAQGFTTAQWGSTTGRGNGPRVLSVLDEVAGYDCAQAVGYDG